MRYIFFVLLLSVGSLSTGCVPAGTPGAAGSGTSGTAVQGIAVDANDLKQAQATRILSANFTAYKFSDNHVGVWERASGMIYALTGVTFEEIQVDHLNAFFLDNLNHQLFRLDLAQKRFQTFNINNRDELTETGKPTEIWDSKDSNSSPFKFLAYNQIGQSAPTPAPSFVFISNSLVAALAGFPGGLRVELFEEGHQAYDCDNGDLFGGAGGTVSGGVMQFVDKQLYQIQIGNSQNCGLLGVENCGDALVRLEISAAGNCLNRTVVQQLNTVSKFGSNQIEARTSYQLSTVDRYVVASNGFLHSQDDGRGSVEISWTDLNLTSIPTNNSAVVSISGNKVYWTTPDKRNFYQILEVGSAPTEIL